MAWAKTDQGAVLLAIRDRLIDQLAPDFNNSTCYLSMKPVPPVTPSSVHNIFCTIAPDNGTFNEGVFEGAGEDHVEEDGGVIISVFSRIKTDRVEHATEALTNATRGLLSVWKKRVLKAISGQNLQDADGNEIFDNLPMPRISNIPNLADDELVGFSLSFDTDFDWDLE